MENQNFLNELVSEPTNVESKPRTESITGIVFLILAGMSFLIGCFTLFIELNDDTAELVLPITFIGSGLFLTWMGQVMNYLKQIANNTK